MTARTWVILGATSIIAEHFAHIAAHNGNHLRLVGRNKEQLDLIAADIQIRYKVDCETLVINMTNTDELHPILLTNNQELDLFIAQSDFTGNEHLDDQLITQLIQLNILTNTLLIHNYLQKEQQQHHIIFLSSVAACRGRAKNSLYGASKAAIEVYLQGLQQGANQNQIITIARLGYIDTKQTYGLAKIFYAASPDDCAHACWDALRRKKRMFYYPGFWRAIMAVITRLPFFIYRRMGAM